MKPFLHIVETSKEPLDDTAFTYFNKENELFNNWSRSFINFLKGVRSYDKEIFDTFHDMIQETDIYSYDIVQIRRNGKTVFQIVNDIETNFSCYVDLGEIHHEQLYKDETLDYAHNFFILFSLSIITSISLIQKFVV